MNTILIAIVTYIVIGLAWSQFSARWYSNRLPRMQSITTPVLLAIMAMETALWPVAAIGWLVIRRKLNN